MHMLYFTLSLDPDGMLKTKRATQNWETEMRKRLKIKLFSSHWTSFFYCQFDQPGLVYGVFLCNYTPSDSDVSEARNFILLIKFLSFKIGAKHCASFSWTIAIKTKFAVQLFIISNMYLFTKQFA